MRIVTVPVYSPERLREIQRMNRRTANAAATMNDALERSIEVPAEDIGTFAAMLGGQKRMLDLGCGTARYADLFVAAGLQYIGADLAEQALRIARERHPKLPFFLQSYRCLHRFTDVSLDGIWSCCVLGHEPKHNMPAVLAELRRVLVPGGVLYAVMPDASYPTEYISNAFPTETPTYFAYWDIGEFGECLEENGFGLVEAFDRVECGSQTYIARAR